MKSRTHADLTRLVGLRGEGGEAVPVTGVRTRSSWETAAPRMTGIGELESGSKHTAA